MQTHGFTLIEFLLYVGILVIILALTGGFLWNIIFGSIKETAYQEVQENTRFALTKITQEIKKATGINNPLSGNASAFLSLAMSDPSLNPTIFDVVDGKIRITQGNGRPYELTSSQVTASSVQFTNLSYQNTPGTVRIEVTIEYLNPMANVEYQASINSKSTVSLSPAGAP